MNARVLYPMSMLTIRSEIFAVQECRIADFVLPNYDCNVPELIGDPLGCKLERKVS